MCVSYTGEIEHLVKPEMRKSWAANKAKIFVLDENNPYDLRFPGKWKQEFTTKNGGIIM